MSIATKIILGLIVLHLVIGFGWLVYKLSARDSDRTEDEEGE